jgi:hypothetical protein
MSLAGASAQIDVISYAAKTLKARVDSLLPAIDSH